MPLIRFPTVKGLVYTIDLSKIADRENPRTVEAPIGGDIQEPTVIDWGDGSSEVVSSGTWHEHTYANGAGDVFTVTLRSATGHLPFCYFNTDGKDTEPTAAAITTALISIDHFAGWMGNNSLRSYGSGLRHTINLEYVDPRIVGLPKYSRLGNALQGSGITQRAESFCLAFLTQCSVFQAAFSQSELQGKITHDLFGDNTTAADLSACFYETNIESIESGAFTGCPNITNLANLAHATPVTHIASDAFDGLTILASIRYIFRNCGQLSGSPYVFWSETETVDSERFPALATAYASNPNAVEQAYYGCPLAIREQVPTAYGGTMTVN